MRQEGRVNNTIFLLKIIRLDLVCVPIIVILIWNGGAGAALSRTPGLQGRKNRFVIVIGGFGVANNLFDLWNTY